MAYQPKRDVVRDLKKTVGHITHEGSQAGAKFLQRCHSTSSSRKCSKQMRLGASKAGGTCLFGYAILGATKAGPSGAAACLHPQNLAGVGSGFGFSLVFGREWADSRRVLYY